MSCRHGQLQPSEPQTPMSLEMIRLYCCYALGKPHEVRPRVTRGLLVIYDVLPCIFSSLGSRVK